MAYLIKLTSGLTYWTGSDAAAWSGQASEAKSFAKKADANAEVETISESWGYALEVVDSKDAESAVVEETVVEEEVVVPPLAGVPSYWTREEVAPGSEDPALLETSEEAPAEG